MNGAPRTDARVLKSRAALRQAMLDLTAEMPFEAVTITALTQLAGLGYATFFRHYSDKAAVLADIADDLIAMMVGRMQPHLLAGDAQASARELVSYVRQHPAICRALIVGAGEALGRDIVRRAVGLVIAAGAELPSPVPRELAIRHGVLAALNALGWWLEQDCALSDEAMTALLVRLVIAPIITP